MILFGRLFSLVYVLKYDKSKCIADINTSLFNRSEEKVNSLYNL
jgi:hypothetical protein